jgi:hypothetical protein
MAVINQYATQVLNLVQSVGLKPTYASAHSDLVFSQSATSNIKGAVANNRLVLTQQSTTRNTLSLHASNYLLFGNNTFRVREGSARNFLVLTHNVDRLYAASNLLSLVQQAIGIATRAGRSQLTFNQKAEYKLNRALTAAQQFTMSGAATAYLQTAKFIATPEVVTIHNQVIFDFDNHTITLTLPAPDFGDVEKLAYTKINRKTRGGDLIIYRDPIWPKSDIFSLRWSNLNPQQFDAAIRFTNAIAGQELTYFDYLGRSFLGIIITPGQGSQVQDCVYTFELDFQVIEDINPTVPIVPNVPPPEAPPEDLSIFRTKKINYINSIYQELFNRNPTQSEIDAGLGLIG